MDFSTLFSGSFKPGSYKIIDPNHPLEFYIGCDDNGYKTFVFITSNKIDELSGTKSIDVKVVKTPSDYRLFISLTNNDMLDIYCKLLQDIFDSTKDVSNKAAGTKEVCKRYLKWRAFFHSKKEKSLTEEETMGLIGELLFLKKLMGIYPKRQAIDSWSGCELTHKDFSIGNTWFEVKTTAVSSDSIKISSLEQLDSDINGNLIVYSVEKMAPEFDGVSLLKVYNWLMEDLDNQQDKDVLTDKIIEAGFNPSVDVNKYVCRLVDKKAFVVDENFPKITHSMVNAAISKAEYSILKTQISDFEEDYEQLR